MSSPEQVLTGADRALWDAEERALGLPEGVFLALSAPGAHATGCSQHVGFHRYGNCQRIGAYVVDGKKGRWCLQHARRQAVRS